jgi:DNA anti-recombination protein RmuC
MIARTEYVIFIKRRSYMPLRQPKTGEPAHEPTIQDVLDALSAFAQHADERFATKEELIKTERRMTERLTDSEQRMTERLMESENRMTERMTERLMESENRMTERMTERLFEVEHRMIDHIDGFITLHRTLDVELASVRSRCSRMEEYMTRVGSRIGLPYQPT